MKKADIICFYSFHYMFGAEDFCEAIKNVATKINSINNKKFLCFTLWNDAKLIAIMKEDEKWITKNIGDIF